MQVKFDKATKTVTVTFEYDPAVNYPLNEKSGKSKTVDGSGGFAPVAGAPGLRVNMNSIQVLEYTPPK